MQEVRKETRRLNEKVKDEKKMKVIDGMQEKGSSKR